jgi:RNA polymerase sigma factor (sigma-70 family)
VTRDHSADLALARACEAGDERAWERFILEYRPILYRAADALDPSGGARDLADSLYADLYGVQERGGERQSLLRYYAGRSSLATWLRAVLSQRFVDRVRAARRLHPLPGDDGDVDAPAAPPAPPPTPHAGAFRRALAGAVADLPARDRLRLGCYYVQALSLGEIGRLLGEHEATASRQLARTRRVIRDDVEDRLRRAGLSQAEIDECVARVVEDAGELDLREVIGAAAGRKNSAPDRSIS